MAFSFRSFFGKEKTPEPSPPGGGFTTSKEPVNGVGNGQFSPSANPFGGMIFKTANGNETPGSPVGSPFSPFSPAGSAAPALTVGDIFPSLPPDIARPSQISPSQPLNIADEVMERVLDSGKAAIPLFEIYRVCPALFQVPVSPQDPRSVPLPPHKIASLLPARAGHGNAGGFGGFGSPAAHGAFAAEPPAGQPKGAETTLFNPSPFETATAIMEEPPSKAPFGNGSGGPLNPFADALPGSPFGNGAGGHANGKSNSHFPHSSPFSPAQGVTSSTSGTASLPGTSPFGQMAQPPDPFASPFKAALPNPPAAPPPAEPGNPFLNAATNASPFLIAQPQSPPSAATPPPVPVPPVNAPEPVAPTEPGAFWLQQAAPAAEARAFELPPPPPANPTSLPPAGTAFGEPPPSPWNSMAAPTQGSGITLPPRRTAASDSPPPPPASSLPERAPSPFERIQALSQPVADQPPAASTPPSPAPPPLPPVGGLAFGSSWGSAENTAPPVPQTASSEPADERVTLPLATALMGCSQQDIGISTDMIPSWVQVSLPLALVRSHLGAGGKVTVPLAEILNSLEPGLRHLVSPSRRDLTVQLTVADLFGAMSAPPPQNAPEFVRSAEPVAPAPEVKLPEGVPWPFAPEATTPSPGQPVAVPANPARPPEPLVQESPKEFFGLPSPPAPQSPPAVTAKPPAAPESRDLRHGQLILRALLGTQEHLDAGAIVRLTASQPGVAAVFCLHDGRTIASSGNGSAEAESFLRQAQLIHEHVQPLVSLAGIDGTETFSMKSDHQRVTFSLQGNVTLGVLHDPRHEEPALREKVTLIGRELTSLLQSA